MDHGELPHGELPPKKKKKTKRKAVAFEEPAAPAPAPAEPEEEEEIGWGAFCDSLELDRRLARAVAQLGWTRPSLVQKATLPVGPRLSSKGAHGLGQDGVLCVTDPAEGAAGQGVRL